MRSRQFISAYTPSNTDPLILEKIFVQRERLLRQIVSKLERSMLTLEKHHILLVGARGSGKTHLLTLAYNRMKQLAEKDINLKNNMRVAWLSEDDTFTELVDIAIAIADALRSSYPEEFKVNYREVARGLQGNEAALAILNALLTDLPEVRSILLMTENMDRTFSQLDGMGQRTWRAFLQEKQRIATLASAQQLVESLSSRDEPFYGFFNIERLNPLSVDQAFELIEKIAKVQQDKELLDYLEFDNNARYRIRALHYLAGGNQRMYVILCELLTKGALDDLVTAFETLADELTPYFQERLRSLPPQQAKIVQYLCSTTAAQSVKTIAEQTFIAETSCSKQLGELKNKRYVLSTKKGKQTFYEMSEPLMRLCLDIKNQRGKPLRLITQFVRAWFSLEEIHLYRQQQGHIRLQQYCESALSVEPVYAKPLIKDLNSLIEQSIENNNFEQALKYVEELKYADLSIAAEKQFQVLFKQATKYTENSNFEESLRKYDEILEISDISKKNIQLTLLNKCFVYKKLDEIDKVIHGYSQLIDSEDTLKGIIIIALVNRGISYIKDKKFKSAILDFSKLINMDDVPKKQIANALFFRAIAYDKIKNYELELQDYNTLIEMEDVPQDILLKALMNRAVNYSHSNKINLALNDFNRILETDNVAPDYVARVLINRGLMYNGNNELDLAIEDYSKIITLVGSPEKIVTSAFFYRGLTYFQCKKFNLAILDFNNVFNRDDVSYEYALNCFLYRGTSYSETNQFELALSDYNSLIDSVNVPDDLLKRVLFNRGVNYIELMHFDLAESDFTVLINKKEVPEELFFDAIFFRAIAYSEQEKFDLALLDYNTIINNSKKLEENYQNALFNRALIYNELGMLDLELNDYDILINMNNISSTNLVDSLFNRAVHYCNLERYPSAIQDFERILTVPDLDIELKIKTLFAFAELNLVTNNKSKFKKLLKWALSEEKDNIVDYGGAPYDLISTLLQLDSSFWATYISILVEVYGDYGRLELLTSNLVRSISMLASEEVSSEELEIWYFIWTKKTYKLEEFELPLNILKAAINAIVEKDIEPLLVLPLEIRKLVLPLLGYQEE